MFNTVKYSKYYRYDFITVGLYNRRSFSYNDIFTLCKTLSFVDVNSTEGSRDFKGRG